MRLETAGRVQWPCLKCSSNDTRSQFDCSIASFSSCLAVPSPSAELQRQASSVNESDTFSNERLSQEVGVLYYNVSRHSERCLSLQLGLVEREGKDSVETWVSRRR